MKNTNALAAAAALLVSMAAVAQTPAPATDPAATPAPAAAPAPAAKPAAPAKKLSYTDDYRITVNHDAKSDGEIVFRVVTKKEGTSTDVKVAISKGTSENSIASAIKEAFKSQLGTKGYSIEEEGGESTIIEGTGGKQYSLVMVSNTVAGISVSIHHD